MRAALMPLLALTAIVSFSACQRKQDTIPASQSIAVATVRAQTVENKLSVATEDVVGTVRAKLRASIEARVSGRIEQMLAVPGQSVKAGDLLVQLDAREIQARLDQSMELKGQSGRDTERLRSLLAENAVSRQEFENVESRYHVAVASVTEAETMLAHTKVTAPFTGVVTRKLADVGDLAAPGRTLLELEDPASLRLEADVPEALIKHIQPGAKYNVRASVEDEPVQARVSEISPVADPASRTFDVKLDLPTNAGLRAGQFARLTVPIGESKALRVPINAVLQRGQMELVFVVANRHAQLRLVKTGKRIGDEIELVSGVGAGEQVVVQGTAQLRDEQPVEVTK